MSGAPGPTASVGAGLPAGVAAAEAPYLDFCRAATREGREQVFRLRYPVYGRHFTEGLEGA